LQVDAHQHFWNLQQVDYPWISPDDAALYRNFEPEDLKPELAGAAIEKTVLVQAADSPEETKAMLDRARLHPWIGAVVGWIPLIDPDASDRTLESYRGEGKLRGVRHLLHDEPDPHWVLQTRVIESLELLASRGLVFEIPAAWPNHLADVPVIADRLPDLTIVIDHLAKPPIKDRGWEPWAEQIAAAASYPRVYAKFSGLVTEADHQGWTPGDLRPYIAWAIECFGVERLMWGSDWPVCTQAATLGTVHRASLDAIETRSREEVDALFGGVATDVYRLGRGG